jgi:Abnormal spindle-like microcephaly-assoc'd, ASPM-SPD-2-Hydin
MKLTHFWQQLMLRLALIGAVLAVCGMWGGLVAPVSAETTALVRTIHASHGTRSVNVFVDGSKVANNLQVASLTITDNASGSPQSVALSGSGTTTSAAVVSLNPTSLSFGNQQVNTTSAVRAVTLTNSGNAALTINSVGLNGSNSGDFRQQNTCPSSSSTLAAGASCTISVTFTPSAESSRSASLTITDNASGSPQSVALSGTGVVGMPPTGSDPYAQPPADNTQQVPLRWLTLIVAVVAAAGIGTALISGRLRRSRPR